MCLLSFAGATSLDLPALPFTADAGVLLSTGPGTPASTRVAADTRMIARFLPQVGGFTVIDITHLCDSLLAVRASDRSSEKDSEYVSVLGRQAGID
jgi:hypothetical protein